MSASRSLRAELTAAFAVLAVVALVLAAITTVRLVEYGALGTVDALLVEEATTLAALVDIPPDRLGTVIREIGAETDIGPAKFAAVIAPDGVLLHSSRPIPPTVVPARLGPGTEAGVVTVADDEARFRIGWAPTAGGGAVVVGVQASGAVRRVQRARWGIWLVALGVLTVLMVGAWIVTGRATGELERVAAEVATVEAGSLTRRLSTGRTLEVDRLVGVLNHVLGRLDRSVSQLRRFTADAAHELRTPIAAARARLEVGLTLPGEQVPREYLLDAMEHLERLGVLTEELLTLSRVEGGAITSEMLASVVDLSAVLREVTGAWIPVAEEEERMFVVAVPPGLSTRGSEPLLKRVVVNLLDNAFRHTPASATITVSAGRGGDQVYIAISDGGPGVHPDVRPYLFQRFRHGPHGGTGLGLSLVREIVERHRGMVEIADHPEGGTIARVTLRACEPQGHERSGHS